MFTRASSKVVVSNLSEMIMLVSVYSGVVQKEAGRRVISGVEQGSPCKAGRASSGITS